MISLIVHSPNLREEIRFPASYEELQLTRWKLGLIEHDPAAYTIGSLATKICCYSEVAERISEVICEEDMRSSVMTLNGRELIAGDNGELPELSGDMVSGKLEVLPGSCSFIVL